VALPIALQHLGSRQQGEAAKAAVDGKRRGVHGSGNKPWMIFGWFGGLFMMYQWDYSIQ